MERGKRDRLKNHHSQKREIKERNNRRTHHGHKIRIKQKFFLPFFLADPLVQQNYTKSYVIKICLQKDLRTFQLRRSTTLIWYITNCRERR